MTKRGKPDIDWKAVETSYRTGMSTLRAIGEEHGVSHVSIMKRAKEYGWVRDLQPRIRAKADDIVTKATVTKTATKKDLVTEAAVIDEAASVVATIRLRHRGMIARAHDHAEKLLVELAAVSDKKMKLAARITSTKTLADALRTLVTMEREAYGIADAPLKLEHTGKDGAPMESVIDTKALTSEQLRVLAGLSLIRG